MDEAADVVLLGALEQRVRTQHVGLWRCVQHNMVVNIAKKALRDSMDLCCDCAPQQINK